MLDKAKNWALVILIGAFITYAGFIGSTTVKQEGKIGKLENMQEDIKEIKSDLSEFRKETNKKFDEILKKN